MYHIEIDEWLTNAFLCDRQSGYGGVFATLVSRFRFHSICGIPSQIFGMNF